MIVDEGKRLLYLDTEKYIGENQIRIYNNKKLCENFVNKGKNIIYDIIENIILEK